MRSITVNQDSADFFSFRTSVTACLLHTFLLACLTQPDVVRKAQAELDQVVGEDVPGFEHMSRLPYVHAVVKEALRWVPVTPLAFPHKCDVDQEYKGFKVTVYFYFCEPVLNLTVIDHRRNVYRRQSISGIC